MGVVRSRQGREWCSLKRRTEKSGEGSRGGGRIVGVGVWSGEVCEV